MSNGRRAILRPPHRDDHGPTVDRTLAGSMVSIEEFAMITVLGAGGRTGSEVARLLLGQGERVRVVGRSRARLASLESDGAEVVIADLADAEALTGAFRGARAAYTLMPYDPFVPGYARTQAVVGAAIVAALRAAAVPRVVALSSLGAELPAGTGFIASLHAQEQRLRSLPDASVVALRCGSFFENALATLDQIAAQGLVADTVAPDLPVPMIATRDIAAVAARLLTRPGEPGFAVRELHGERDLSYAAMTGILGEALGRPGLPYIQVDEEAMAAALRAAGLAEESVAGHLALNRALNDGTIRSLTGRTRETTTPTSFEAFAAGLAASLTVPAGTEAVR